MRLIVPVTVLCDHPRCVARMTIELRLSLGRMGDLSATYMGTAADMHSGWRFFSRDLPDTEKTSSLLAYCPEHVEEGTP